MRNPYKLLAGLAVAALLPTPGAAQECEGAPAFPSDELQTIEVVNGLANRPLYVTAPPEDPTRLFVVEQDGFIRLHKRGDAPEQWSTFLDIQSSVISLGGEQGLLGLAFDPEYETTGHFYVNYTAFAGGANARSVVARYSRSSTNPDLADPASEERILTLSQPESNHNGGQIFFGPEGYLYVFFGDGGGGGDAHGACGNGQNRSTLLGKVLRIDVRDLPGSLDPDCGLNATHRVPPDNPFVDGAGGDCDEIYALGVRNPWRNDIDPATGDLYVADVGETCWEEINWVAGSEAGGQNFGWRQMEGSQCHDAFSADCDPDNVPCGSSPDCNDPSLTLPIHEYGGTVGSCRSVSGGVVYRGCFMPELSGTYFWGDYCGGSVRSFRVVDGVKTEELNRTSQILDPPDRLSFALTSFGRDAEGELFIVDRNGAILKLLPTFEKLEVSAPGSADQFLLGESEWTWQDLQFVTEHPVDFYRVFRGRPNDTHDCVFATPEPRWEIGDTTTPNPGEVFSYFVHAVSSAGTGGETNPGGPEGARPLGSRSCL